MIRTQPGNGTQVAELISIDHEFLVTLALDKPSRCRMVAGILKQDRNIAYLTSTHAENTCLLQLKMMPKQPDAHCVVFCQVDDPEINFTLNTS